MSDLTEEEYEKYLHDTEDRIIEGDDPLPLQAALLDPAGKEVSYAGYARVKLPRSDGAFDYGTVTFPLAVGGSADVASIAVADKRGNTLFTQDVPLLHVNTGMRVSFDLKLNANEV